MIKDEENVVVVFTQISKSYLVKELSQLGHMLPFKYWWEIIQEESNGTIRFDLELPWKVWFYTL